MLALLRSRVSWWGRSLFWTVSLSSVDAAITKSLPEFMGIYSLTLLLLEMLLIICGIIREQRFAVWIFLMGLAVLFLWGITVYLQISFPYQRLGLSIYSVLILGMLVTLAGGIGLVVKGLRFLVK